MKRAAFTFVVCLCLGTCAAWASPNDFIDWGQLGPSFSVLSTPQSWTSVGGLTGEVGLANLSDFERRDQGNGWNGNFNSGDHLLWNRGAASGYGAFLIAFDQPVSGFGTQVQSDVFGSFVATLTAYDSGFNVLGQIVMNGNSNSNGDGSAIFIDYNGATNSVFYFGLSLSDLNGNDDEAMGTGVVHIKGQSITPEPASLLLLGSGLLAAIGYGRRRLG
jgi:PEP-CTERM motif